MSNAKIVVVDYGAGNLYSVKRALEVSGAKNISVSKDPTDILNADKLLLPGVGAFSDGIQGLKENGLDSVLLEFAVSGKPMLGICLGMQMLASISYEFGEYTGLDIIPGDIIALPELDKFGHPLKVPSIGWNSLQLHDDDQIIRESIIKSLTPEKFVYLVHSFYFSPTQNNHVLATYNYGGHTITAAVKKDNITGLQFHPEKSGEVGLAILSDFIL